MKTLLIILLMLPCWCVAQVRPDKPEPAKALEDIKIRPLEIYNGYLEYYENLSAPVWQQMAIIDSLKVELLKCQEKSRKDEIIIEGIFNTIQKKVTIQTKNYYQYTK